MPRPSPSRLAAGAVLLLVAAAVPADTAVAGATGTTAGTTGTAGPTAGSAGIGDPYFPRDGNGGYDVAHYEIHDGYHFSTKQLVGHTIVTATATQDLSSFHLDLVLTPVSVRVDGVPASFSHGAHELVVTPRTPISHGSTFTVSVRYKGRPATIKVGGEKPFFDDGHEMLAINEPHIAPWWFAANDHPSDRATYQVSMTVPQGQQAISNGERRSRTTKNGRTTWTWAIDHAIAPYQAFVVAGKFRMETGTAHGYPYTVAVSRQLSKRTQDAALGALRRSPAIVAWEASRFGAYPYDSTGGVVTAIDTGFALECASRPVYSWWGSAREQASVEVHELAHQWFGDEVSVARWRDIWLNEGFATWVEWAYAEAHGGPTAERQLRRTYRAYGKGDPFWHLHIANPGPKHLFDYPVYERGGMTLQALRHRIGPARFATLLRRWVKERAGRPSHTAQFERLAETVSGQNLDGFFDHWLRTGSKPATTAANGLD